MADSMNLTGFREMAKKLKELGPRIAKNRLRRANSAGAAVIRDDARERVQVRTGETKRDIQIKRERDQRGDDLVVSHSVYVRSGKKSRIAGRARNVDKDSFHWIFLEFGTAKMRAFPFLRPAFESKKEAAVEAVGKSLDEGIQAEAERLAREIP